MSNVAVVGLGGMGLRHCEAISKLENVNLISVCDIDIDRVKETSHKYKIKSGYTNWEDMIMTESIDLIIIATNGDTHHDITIFASENGVPRVLCEKPITTSLNKAQNMISVCEKNNTKLVIHHIRRWSESYERLKKMIDDGVIGFFLVKLKYFLVEILFGKYLEEFFTSEYSLKKNFTILSSIEWKVTTAITPPTGKIL